MNNAKELKDFLDSLYCGLAQYGSPSLICDAMDKAGKRADVLTRIHAGVAAYFDMSDCLDMKYWELGETVVGYAWQVINRFF